MLSPGQSWTDFMPASRSTQSVVLGEQGLEQRGLADARRTKDRHRRLAVRLGQPLVGGYDAQSHRVLLRLALEAPRLSAGAGR